MICFDMYLNSNCAVTFQWLDVLLALASVFFTTTILSNIFNTSIFYTQGLLEVCNMNGFCQQRADLNTKPCLDGNIFEKAEPNEGIQVTYILLISYDSTDSFYNAC